MMDEKKQGKVFLVGAGPGRADLITVRGAEVLKIADCVIYDKLVNPDLLNYTQPNAEIINVPKRIGEGSFTQEQINKLLIEKALTGQTIVRLKGGDPCIFGRGSREASALAEAGIDFEIVPGVTAGIAVGAYTGIMLTDRNYSSQLLFVTGREADDKQRSNIDWRCLAEFGGTIVFYMAVGNMDFIVEQLLKNGISPDTPAAVIADVSLPTQKMVKTSLRQLIEKSKEAEIEPPAVVVIGTAADSDYRLNWFVKRPLFGKNIVLTRDSAGNIDFAVKIINEGGNPVKFATMKFSPLTQKNQFLHTLAKLTDFDWVIFTSANGVTVFFDCLQNLAKDPRAFGSVKIAAIGTKTAAKLAEFGIQADFVPTVFTSQELGRQLVSHTNLQGKKILLLRSQLASNKLADLLTEAKAEVNDVPVYTIAAEKNQGAWLTEKIRKGRIDWLTFASPFAAKAFFEQISADLVKSANIKIASIGPVTCEQLKALGIRVDVTAAKHTIDGLLAAIKGACK